MIIRVQNIVVVLGAGLMVKVALRRMQQRQAICNSVARWDGWSRPFPGLCSPGKNLGISCGG